ncbi:ubiquitin family protein [Klebsormidium nitens]|uniref:Ubiquitin family protein n=1 Tax=Klebsormidium nitens TaxID=105231 RepID=A0A1Y1IC62_KLENI|nr:ubiquitin family protein [Klebsormidium nitens]|eukprot:GAQ86681.1 ubiquitin family protein [Klebsormidium nitens]
MTSGERAVRHPSESIYVDVPEILSLLSLKERVAEELTRVTVDRLKLILGGKVLTDGPLNLKEGDCITAMVVPKPPPQQAAPLHVPAPTPAEPDEDEDLRFRLAPDAPRIHRTIAWFLREKLKAPDWLLVAFFSVHLRTWALLLSMCIFGPLLARWDLGPVYILGTCFAIILLNLGTRKPGEASAYSVFNDGFQELPGTLNAGQLDDQIRRGQY